MDFYAWDWVKDAFYHFGTALADVWCGIRCLWWAVVSLIEWAAYNVKGETDVT